MLLSKFMTGKRAALVTAGCTAYISSLTLATDVIAYTGQAAPGVVGATLFQLGDLRVSRGGSIAYWALLAGQNVTVANDGVVVEVVDGVTALRLREGMPVQGLDSFMLASVGDPSYAADGGIGVSGAFAPVAGQPVASRVAHMVDRGAGPEFMFGDAAVTTAALVGPTNTIASGRTPVFTGGGSGFSGDGPQARVLTFTPDRVIAPGTLAPAAPGVPMGALFQRFGPASSDASGALTFTARIGTTAATTVQAWYLVRAGVLSTIAVEGTQMAGAIDGQLVREVGQHPVIKGSALVAYVRLAGAGAPQGNDTAIVRLRGDGTFEKVAQLGSPAPGAPVAAFATLDQVFTMDDWGNITFGATLLGGGATMGRNTGLWSAPSGGTPTLLVREGDAVPGYTQEEASFAAFSRPYAGPDGTVYFTATLRGNSVTPKTSNVLCASDRGDISIVARTGQAVSLQDGRTGEITDIMLHATDHVAGFGSATLDGRVGYQVMLDTGASAFMFSRVRCPVDINRDGGIDGADAAEYIMLNAAEDSAADLDYNGVVDDADLAEFFVRWSGGEC